MSIFVPGQGEMMGASGSYETYEDYILDIARLIKRHANTPNTYVKVSDIRGHKYYMCFAAWQSNRAEWVRLESILNGRSHYDPPANSRDL